MSSFFIDIHDGTVNLPYGTRIGRDLSQEAFRATPAYTSARSQDFGTLPFIHYHFSAGEIDGNALLVSLCFYDQVLLYVSLTADLYPPGPKDWSSYSLKIEAATKRFHDHLLRGMLGKPTKGGSLWLGRLPEGDATLKRPLVWRFSWGTVGSGHDCKGGGTAITISYGNRKEVAEKMYRSRLPWSGNP